MFSAICVTCDLLIRLDNFIFWARSIVKDIFYPQLFFTTPNTFHLLAGNI